MSGLIDANGHFIGQTSRIGMDEITSLTGQLQPDAQGRLVGNLVWGSTPPLTYTYTLTLRTP